jgi:hypothetical protein
VAEAILNLAGLFGRLKPPAPSDVRRAGFFIHLGTALQAAAQLSVAAEMIFFRPLKRAKGDSMLCILRLAGQFRNRL